MATLNVLNTFSILTDGVAKSGKHGLAANSPLDPLTLTVTGDVHQIAGTLPTATAVALYDNDDDMPATFSYLYFWADQDVYVQVIGTSTSLVLKVDATVPLVLPNIGSVLGAASVTPIAGGVEPTLEVVDSVVVGNYSGSTARFNFAVIK